MEGRNISDYALYKGEELIGIGSVEELASLRGVLPKTIRYYGMPAYHKKTEKRKNARNYLVLIKLEDEG